MSSSNQDIADAARDSLARILATDSSEWSQGDKRQRALEIDRLTNLITEFERKAARQQGRQIYLPAKQIFG